MYPFLSSISCRSIGALYDLTSDRHFPKVVRIETTNACNAKCTICPHVSMTRPVQRMREELFKKIVDECAINKCQEIHLHNFGEPLLDKRLESFVLYAKNKGINKVKIFSNGAIISEKRAIGLIEAGIDEIKISFDGATKEEFEIIRTPLKFDEVVGNIINLVKLRDMRKSHLKVKVNCCSTSDKSKTMELLESVVDKFSFSKIHNWGTEDYSQLDSSIRKPCSRLWRTFTILVNGDISLCCLDYDGKEKLGNITAENNTISTTWNNERYTEVRNLHRSSKQTEISLCKNCSKSFF